MTREQVAAVFKQFTEDVKCHTMTVAHDDGLYRHLRFSKGGSYCMAFDVITWPGHICYTGDMGCYEFARIPDMFEFFRRRAEGDLIDLGYLRQKCEAADLRCGVEVFDRDTFERLVKERAEEFAKELTEDEAEYFWERIENDVLGAESLEAALQSTFAFRFEKRDVFPDFWDSDLNKFTHHFVWCAFAITWAVAQYDAAKAGQAVAQ